MWLINTYIPMAGAIKSLLNIVVFVVVLIWQFTTIWNDYIVGLVVLSNPRLAPVNVAVQNLAFKQGQAR